MEGGGKDFRHSAEVYAAARKQVSFIIVSPVIPIDGGGHDQRNLPVYYYPAELWNEIDRIGVCEEGLEPPAALAMWPAKRPHGSACQIVRGMSTFLFCVTI